MRPQSEFSLSWPHGHRTRYGARAVFDRRFDDGRIYPLSFRIVGDDWFRDDELSSFTDDGRYMDNGTGHPLDLFNAPAPEEPMPDRRSSGEKRFTKGWPHGYVTSDGLRARVICWDRQGVQGEVIALVPAKDGATGKTYEATRTYHLDGSGAHGGHSIWNAPEPKPRLRLTINVYEGGGWSPHQDRLFADNHAAIIEAKRIACLEFDREYEPGEGL